MLAPRPAADAAPEAVAAIAAFMRAGSLEATRPRAQDVAALKAAAAPGASVYLSAVLTRPQEEAVAQARLVRAAGLEPVPHLAVRNFSSGDALRRFLDRLAGEAGVRHLLVIAGDRAEPAGPFRGALEAIDSGLIARSGIAEIGISGYPDGHPRIADHELERVLAAKLEAAAQTGLKVNIVTQFCLDAAPIIAWVRRLRAHGVDHPVRVGLAGPTSLTTLMRYAKRCGVRAATQGLARNAGLIKHLLGAAAPDGIIRALIEANKDGELGDITPHLFSFGGIGATARWAAGAAAGRVKLDRDGFAVEAA
ncbi:MAG TPA: methylenetetrahydrofolate reductase [Xanthobacteraceae bacterium]|nr:methylenetetrahydrofolate reductase [Xanthobacteraceae bacterium]